jgi:hypothetical protein
MLSARQLDIGPKGFSPRDDISRRLMTMTIWKRPCINLFITYFARADNMLLPFTRGQITCYCPRKILLPRRQITRRKLCFYYTCKFGVISMKYVIMKGNDRLFGNDFNRIFKEGCKLNAHWYKMGIAKKNYLICVSTGNNSTCVCSEWGERVRLRTSDQ